MLISTLIESYKVWLSRLSSWYDSMSSHREWCRLGVTEGLYDTKVVHEFFSRKDLNEEYKTRAKEKNPKNKQATAFIKKEIHDIYSFEKGFRMRHKSRLGYYRDDAEFKGIRTWNLLVKSEALFNQFKKAA